VQSDADVVCLAVKDWEWGDREGTLIGEVENNSDWEITSLKVHVDLYDDGGRHLGSAQADGLLGDTAVLRKGKFGRFLVDYSHVETIMLPDAKKMRVIVHGRKR